MDLPFGAAIDVMLGPVIDSSTNDPKADLAFDDAGVAISVLKGGVPSTPTLTDETDADWWFRATGTLGMYLLRVPASFLEEGDVGKDLLVRMVADGVYTFGSIYEYTITDPAAGDKLISWITASDESRGLIVDLKSVTDPAKQVIAEQVLAGYDLVPDDPQNPSQWSLVRNEDEQEIAVYDITTGTRDPVTGLALGS